MSRDDDISITAIVVVAMLALGAVVGGAWGCASCTSIKPGHVGVSIKKCGGGGVSDKPIPTGYYWKSVWCEDVEMYPTSLQTIVLSAGAHEGSPHDESIVVTSSEGLPISVDISLSFTLDPSKVPAIYTKYRSDIEKIAHTFMRQTIREALQGTFAKYTAEQLYSDKKEFARAEVQQFLVDHLGPEGFLISQFTINEVRVPEQVTAAINSKVAMKQEAQRAEAEVQKTKALANQRTAQAQGEADALRTKADAEAYYNTTVSKSLTPEYVQYKIATEKWNGALPQYMGGNSPMPFLDVGK